MTKHDKENALLSDMAADGERECARVYIEGVFADRERRRREYEEVYTRAWREGWQAAQDGEDCVPRLPLDLLIGEIEVPA